MMRVTEIDPPQTHADNRLSRLLAERDWLLADGAVGTNLFARGLEAGEAPELWNITEPDKIRALHQEFVDAGSDILLTNSFGGTRFRLTLHGAQSRVHALNKRAAEIAREVADNSGRDIVVAGSVGPTGEILAPVGSLDFEDAASAFEEQIQGLIEGGADVIWAETISSREEICAISEAAKRLNAPLCAMMSFDTAGRTMMGLTSRDYIALAQEMAQTPLALGANCGVGASDLLRTMLGFQAEAPSFPLIAKANAGIPKYVDGKVEYDGSPELMASYAVLARRAGACIVGGCCGSTGAHLRAMRLALESADPAPTPSLDEIARATGAFSSETDGIFGDQKIQGRRTGRRRRQCQ
jgi:5-methyltetrahydrofolate--homocysteine methyltransferase